MSDISIEKGDLNFNEYDKGVCSETDRKILQNYAIISETMP